MPPHIIIVLLRLVLGWTVRQVIIMASMQCEGTTSFIYVHMHIWTIHQWWSIYDERCTSCCPHVGVSIRDEWRVFPEQELIISTLGLFLAIFEYALVCFYSSSALVNCCASKIRGKASNNNNHNQHSVHTCRAEQIREQTDSQTDR